MHLHLDFQSTLLLQYECVAPVRHGRGESSSPRTLVRAMAPLPPHYTRVWHGSGVWCGQVSHSTVSQQNGISSASFTTNGIIPDWWNLVDDTMVVEW